MNITTFWDKVTTPSPLLTRDQKQHARIVTSFSLACFFAVVFILLLNDLSEWVETGLVELLEPEIIAIPISLISYALSRTRFYKVAAYITIAIPFISISYIFSVIGITQSFQIGSLLNYISLGVIVSGLLLNARTTLIVGLATIVVMMAIYLQSGVGVIRFPVLSFLFAILVTIVVAVATRIRDRYMWQLEAARAELLKINETLEQRVAARTVELKSARDEAMAAKRIADENSRLKSEFLATMSHELRTPMNAIEGFTGIILKRMAGTDYNEKTARYLEKIKSNSKRLLGLINDFLDLSRIESGRYELAYLPIAPHTLAQQWRETLSVLADNKGLTFDVDVDPELPVTIYGDEESLSKIVINLVGNAIKFTEQGLVKLSLQKHNQVMVLQVSDTGMGIPPHAREYIFEEFRQVDQSSKRQHGGTGLGLAIVQRLVRAMNGTVTLESEVGVGSTFTVQIPIATEQLALEGVM